MTVKNILQTEQFIKLFLILIINIVLMLEILGQTMPLGISILLICAISLSFFFNATRNYGLINIATFFISLFFSAVITLWPRSFDENYITGVHSDWFQTTELFEKVAQVSLLALAATYIGWMFKRRKLNNKLILEKWNDRRVLQALFWTAIFIGFIFSLVSRPDSTLLSATYNEILRPQDKGLKASYGFAVFSVVVSFYAYLKKPTLIKKILLSSLFVFAFIYCGFLTGSRVEQFGCLVGLVVVYQKEKNKIISKKLLIVSGLLLFILLLGIGFVRQGNRDLNLDTVISFVKNGGLLYTQKDEMTTALTVFGLEKNGYLNIDYGKTYWDVFVSVFPRTFDPNRPKQFDTKIGEITQWPGGTFLINEPYISGGGMGILIFFVLLGWLFKNLENKKENFYWGLIYLGFMCGLPRLVYYGLLPAYRFLHFSIFYCLIYLFFRKINYSKDIFLPKIK